MTDETKILDEIENNNNRNNVRCQFCYSLILKKQQGEYEYFDKEFDLPLMHQKHTKDVNTIATEPERHFWLVRDMFIFENIGFSHTVLHWKYLTCADCDMGPVGFHDIENKKCYIALKRVRHGDAPEAVMEDDETSPEHQLVDDDDY